MAHDEGIPLGGGAGSGTSASPERAEQRRIERGGLDALIEDFEKVNGPADPEAVAAKRADLTGESSGSVGAG